ncbi:hypothetical protein [Arenimonas sp. MALMAid1274]|uniref:hypothetical protein n=1 Tax=Arenimonas sp. MALMAid1274 TaxID=3411630 RepID=UPI003BA3A88A
MIVPEGRTTMRVMMRSVGLLLGCLVLDAGGAVLHKCVGAYGVASYQTLPCADARQTHWVREIGDVRPPLPAVAVEAPRTAARSGARRPVASPRPAQPDPRLARCDKARREAEHVRDRLWNRLGFRERSALDAKVARACSRH